MARISRLFHTTSLCYASISIRNLLGHQILFFQIPPVCIIFKIVLTKIKQDLLLLERQIELLILTDLGL